MSRSEVLEKITSLLLSYVGEESSVQEGDRYVEMSALDSFALLSFVSDVEECFDLSLTPDQLMQPSVQTVGGLADLVVSLIARAGE